MSVARILVVNLTRLGDLLQTSPTIAALRELHPEAEITFLAERNFADVCDAMPGVDRVVRLELDRVGNWILTGSEKLLEAYQYVEQVIRELRAERYDLAFNFSSSRMSAVFMGLLRIPDVRGWSMTPDGFRVIYNPWARLFATMCLNRQYAAFNLVDYYRAMAGLGSGPRRLLYDVTDASREAARALLAPSQREDGFSVALQLGASKAIRQWPRESFAALGRRLVDAGGRVVLIGGGGDKALAAAVAREVGEGVIDACGRTTIPELGALLERVDLLVTGDTGPMHMAAAVGTPVVGMFFGPALPFDTGPYGEGHVMLHAAVECAPCEHAVQCLNPFCRKEITPDLVADAALARLAGDWSSMAQVARRAGSVRLYRSAFDDLGFFDCEPLGGGGASPSEATRRAYRSLWLAALCGAPLRAAQPGGVDQRAFGALGALAREGAQTALRLRAAASRRPLPIAEIERLGAALEAIDGRVLAHGVTYRETAVLTQMFKFGKENLEGEDVAVLAGEAIRLHSALAAWCDGMRAALSGVAVDGRPSDASLHQ